jgi:hypothetical protein
MSMILSHICKVSSNEYFSSETCPKGSGQVSFNSYSSTLACEFFLIMFGTFQISISNSLINCKILLKL